MDTQRLYALIRRHRLFFAIIFVLIVSFIMTAISLSLYITSGTSSLDLSRPGYMQVRDQVVQPQNNSFSDTGPLNQAALDEFKKLYSSQRSALNGLGNYDDASLSDESLRLR